MISLCKQHQIFSKEDMEKAWPISRCFDLIPPLSFTHASDLASKRLHAQQKKIGWNWITLSNPSRRVESFKFATIKKEGYDCCGNTAHDEVDNILGKTKMFQNHFHKTPLKAIISLLKVNFYYHVPFLTLSSFQRIDKFLGNNNIICGSPPF